jgi:hypothetical protein
MASVQEKAQCFLWLAETESPVTVQQMFRAQYGNNPPDVKLIKSRKTKFLETGSVHKDKSSGRPSVSEERVEAVQAAFTWSPQKSIRRASLELQMSRSTVHKVVCKHFKLFLYKVQIVQQIKPDDLPRCEEFVNLILNHIDEDNDFFAACLFL